MNRRYVTVLSIVGVLLLFSLSASAQTRTGRILGQVVGVDGTLIVRVNRSLVTVDANRPDELKEIDKKPDVIPGGIRRLENENRGREFSLAMLPVEEISTEERIKLSIDLAYRPSGYRGNYIYESSIVDVHDGKIAFFGATERDIARFDVVRWDDEKIYCKFSVARPFTALESIAGGYLGAGRHVSHRYTIRTEPHLQLITFFDT